jgi:hypothetical protein
MEEALHRFHTFKDVFLLGQPTNKAKPKANSLSTELIMERNVDNETNAESWTPSKTWQKMNASQNYICHKVDDSKEFNVDFDFLKIHLMSQWVE